MSFGESRVEGEGLDIPELSDQSLSSDLSNAIRVMLAQVESAAKGRLYCSVPVHLR